MNDEFLTSASGAITGQHDVITISVFGPESSGKSTMLNAIFGC